jgi:hypothetical protein
MSRRTMDAFLGVRRAHNAVAVYRPMAYSFNA